MPGAGSQLLELHKMTQLRPAVREMHLIISVLDEAASSQPMQKTYFPLLYLLPHLISSQKLKSFLCLKGSKLDL